MLKVPSDDELVFEAPPPEVDESRALVKSEMESARKLHVPFGGGC